MNHPRSHNSCSLLHVQGKNKTIDGLPPTRIQHVKRAAYQAGHCWAHATIVTPELSSPSECGWKKNANGWDICWSTLPEASITCQELISCHVDPVIFRFEIFYFPFGKLLNSASCSKFSLFTGFVYKTLELLFNLSLLLF